jgi:hypothetical protein
MLCGMEENNEKSIGIPKFMRFKHFLEKSGRGY